MSFVHGKNIFVLLNGYNITGYLNKIDCPKTADTAETSTFGNLDKTYIPGMKNATLSADGFFDGDVGAIDEQLNTIITGTNLASNIIWFPAGNYISGVGYGLQMIKTAYGINGTKDDAVKISFAGQSNISTEKVILIQPLSAKTVDGNGTANDNSVQTLLGGSAFLQVTNASSNCDFLIQHSSDNFVSDVTTLATFTNVTGNNKHERVVIDGTIKRYTRAVWDFNGGAGATFAIALHRN